MNSKVTIGKGDKLVLREEKELRTKNSKSFLNNDNTISVQQTTYSQHYFDGQAWQDIDTTLRMDTSDANNTYSMKKNNFKVRLNHKRNNQTVTFQVYEESVSYQAQKMNNVIGVVYGNTITYPNAWQSTDLLYQVQNDELKMELHLADNKAPKKFEFEIKMKAVKPRVNLDSSIDFIDDKGKVNFKIPQLWIKDASSDKKMYDRLNVNVVQKGVKTFIEIALNDKGLQYPVIIDPTTVYTNWGTNYVWSMTDPAIGHLIGRVDGNGWSANVNQDSESYLSYGPYVSTLDVGSWATTWSMKIDNNNVDNASIVRLEIADVESGEILAFRYINRQQFIHVNQFQDFSLSFINAYPGHQLEFKTYWYKNSYLQLQNISTSKNQSINIVKKWSMTDPGIGHVIGRQEGTAWTANMGQDNSGFLSYGPYVADLKTGKWTTTWSMKIDNNNYDNSNVVRLEVVDSYNGEILAYKEVTRQQFMAPYLFQNFSVDFIYTNPGHPLEFRTHWYKSALIHLKTVMVSKFAAIDVSGQKWKATDPGIGHLIGREDGTGWSADMAHDNSTYLSFGPYVAGLKAGQWTTTWFLKIDNNTADNANVVRLEIFDTDTGEILAFRDIGRRQFKSNQFQEFALTFFHFNPSHRLEFRTYWYGNAYINFNGVGVKPNFISEFNEAWNMSGPSIYHSIGRNDGIGWSANTTQDTENFLSYGPYAKGLSANRWNVTWSMSIDNTTVDDVNIMRLEVSDVDSGKYWPHLM